MFSTTLRYDDIVQAFDIHESRKSTQNNYKSSGTWRMLNMEIKELLIRNHKINITPIGQCLVAASLTSSDTPELRITYVVFRDDTSFKFELVVV